MTDGRKPGLAFQVFTILLAFAGIAALMFGAVGWFTLKTSYYPGRDEVREVEGRVDVAFVNTPGRYGVYLTFIETSDRRIGEWPGCTVVPDQIPQVQGKRGRALVFENRVVQLEIDGETLCKHEPSRDATVARFSTVLLVIGFLALLAVAGIVWAVMRRGASSRPQSLSDRK